MNRDGEKRNGPSTTSLFVFGMMIVFAGYPISLGPVLALNEAGYIPRGLKEPLETLYSPIAWFCAYSDRFASFYLWYIELWTTPSSYTNLKS